MESPTDNSVDVLAFEPRLDDNWNERKHLEETEFALRHATQLLLQQGDSIEKLEEARGRERASRVALSKNNDEYDFLIEKWAAEAFKSKL